MEFIKIDLNSKFDLSDISIALGNFDGFHRGHISLIDELNRIKIQKKYKTAILLFENHSRDYIFLNDSNRLMSFDDKVKKLKELNIDYVFSIVFNEKIMGLSPEEFLDFLTKNLNVKHIIVGEDYRFSKKKMGNSAFISHYMKEKGLSSSIIDKVDFDGEKISSRDIINLIENGNVKYANELLGYTYSLKGIVRKGYQRGRKMGYPTANIECTFKYVIPKDGVYFTKTKIDNVEYFSFTSVGHNPTFENQDRTIETHIFDFSRDIYGCEIEVFFFEKIRENSKFKSLEDLIEQIKKDRIKCDELISLLENN